MHKNPKPTVGAILYDPDSGKGNILLTRRNIEPFKDYWCLPGGHIEFYEKAIDAVKREVKEETNLGCDPAFMGFFEEIYPDKELHNIALMFYGAAKGEAMKDDTEVIEIAWFTIEEALSMNLAFGHVGVLGYYKKMVLNL